MGWFGKKAAQEPDEIADEPFQVSTIIGSDATVAGSISFSRGVRVDGVVDGSVTADGSSSARSFAVVGESGTVTGDVAAPRVVVHGKVRGDVRATDTATLGPEAEVVGQVVAPRVTHERLSEPRDG